MKLFRDAHHTRATSHADTVTTTLQVDSSRPTKTIWHELAVQTMKKFPKTPYLGNNFPKNADIDIVIVMWKRSV